VEVDKLVNNDNRVKASPTKISTKDGGFNLADIMVSPLMRYDATRQPKKQITQNIKRIDIKLKKECM
jgi:hypothetical protein